MKKILMITSQYPNNVSTFISRDIEILTEAGYQIDLFALYPEEKEKWKYVPDEAKKLIKENKLNVFHISYFELVKFFFNLIFLFSSKNYRNDIKEILKDSKRFGNTQLKKSIYTLLWANALIKKSNNKYSKVISYWGNYSATAAFIYSKYSKSKPKFYTYLHAGVDLYRDQIFILEKLLHASKIITVCKFNVDFLEKLLKEDFSKIKEKITIYHLPLKIKPLQKINKENNQIIAVGRLAKAKGLDYLLEACKILKDENIIFKLLIVGDGLERKHLENKVGELELESFVNFTGQVPYSEVEKYISSSTVLAHCSSQLGDAVPTVIKESLSLGTPVIGSNIVGIPELLDYGNCGLLFKPKDSYSLAHKLRVILSNKKLQNKMSVEGRTFAENMFNFEKNKQLLIKTIEN